MKISSKYEIDPEEVLETRLFICHCNAEAKYFIYKRTSPQLIDCLCGKKYFYDWKAEKFIEEAPLLFQLMDI